MRYWDMTEQERAGLTEDDLQKYLDYELMERGVVKVTVPIIQEVEEVDLPRKSYYKVRGQKEYGNQEFNAVFKTMEEAQVFASLKPSHADYEYSVGSDYMYASPYISYSIEEVTLCDYSEVMNQKSVLDKNREIKNKNEKSRKEHADAVKAMREATDGLWGDFYECKSKASRYQTIVETFNKYLEMTNNDEQIAARFLSRAFSVDDIEEARKWYGVIPGNFTADEAAA